jgi:cytochrome c
MSKQRIVKSMTVLLVLVMAVWGTTAAAEQATKEECVAKAKAAAELFKEIGREAALKKLNEKESEYVWKDTYVFVSDMKIGTILAHPVNPGLIGKSLAGIKDVNGKLFFAECMTTAKNEGEGWISYMWPKPGEKKPSPKNTYVYRVPGDTIFMGAGVYGN